MEFISFCKMHLTAAFKHFFMNYMIQNNLMLNYATKNQFKFNFSYFYIVIKIVYNI